MSTENESTFDKVICSNSASESTPIRNDNSRTWSPLLSFNKPQTSSIKKLDLSYKRPIDLYSRFTDCDLSAKRFKINNIDNFSKNEPLTLRRTPSKISLSTPSTISTGFLADFKCLAPYDKLSGRDSPTSSLNNLNLSNKNSDSLFYPGKTTFGGANLRKNIRRFTTTPYSRANIKCIEPVQLKSNLIKSSQDLPLSSVTQRILDRLEKSATPIQDAKSRISTLINSKNKSRLFDTTNPSEDNKGRCKVDFDYKPLKYVLKKATENQGDNDNKNDNLLGQIEKLNQIKQAEIDLLKDTEKEKSSEKNIFIPRKDVSSGKITSRDVKKQRKINDIGDDDTDYLKSFQNVQPLLISQTIKPFTLKSQLKDSNSSNNENTSKNKESMFSFSSPKLVATFSPTASPTIELNFSSAPKNISNENETPKSAPIKSITSGDIFKSKFDSTTSHGSLSQLINQSQSNIWFCPTCSTKNELNVDKCVSCEEINPKTAQNKETSCKSTVDTTKQLNELFKKDTSKTWTCPTCSVSNDINENVCVSCEESNPNKKPSQTVQKDGTLESSNVTKPPLNQLFKQDKSKNWSCPTCMVSNESNATKCVSCEEANPNNPVKQATAFETNKLEFKFGSFDSMKKDSTTKSVEEVKDTKSSISNGWICFYCKAENDSIKNICDQCKKVKVVAATKDQVHKFYETQTYKFGNKSSDIFKPTVNEPKETSEFKSTTEIEKKDDSSKTSAFISKDNDLNLSDDKNKPEQTTGFGFKFSNFPKTTSTIKFGSNDATSTQSFPSLSQPSSLTFNSNSNQTSNESLFKFPNISESSSVSKPAFGIETKPALEISTDKTESTNILATTTTTITTTAATITTNVPSLSTNTTFGQKFSLTTSNESTLKAPSLFSFSKNESSSLSSTSTPFLSSTTTASEKTSAPAPLFLFGNSSLNPTTTASMTPTISTFGKNFTSPIEVPKINIGPTGITQEIKITFPKEKLTSNPGFDFGSKSNAFSNQSMFGSIPSSFNFMGTSGNTNQQSLFSFGAKPSDLGSQTSMMKPQTGFTFGTPANNTLSFNSVASQPPPSLIEPQINQPVMPTFNSMITPPANEPFKFGQSFPSFDNPDNSCNNNNNNNSNCFSFLANADQFSGGNANPKRTIKKAKRRLPTKP